MDDQSPKSEFSPDEKNKEEEKSPDLENTPQGESQEKTPEEGPSLDSSSPPSLSEKSDKEPSEENLQSRPTSKFPIPKEQVLFWSKIILGAFVIFLMAFYLGSYWGGSQGPSSGTSKKKGSDIKYWSCSMHPQIKMPGPGKCPVCNMDLIPVREGGGSEEDPTAPVLTLGERARKLAEISTEPVLYRRVYHRVELIGKIAYDETKLTYITSRFPGRIDRLFVDFTGTLISKGDHMAEIYSPEFRAAQEELISDQRTYQKALKSSDTLNIRLAKEKMEASQKKLKLWDLTDNQIQEILKRGATSDHITIYATEGGTVLHRNATVGLYIKEGQRLYTIADLKRVWLAMDAYETDVPWLYYGQKVSFEVESFPGKPFEGKVAFIDPVIDPKTRTVRVRVNVPNSRLLLKPEMLVRARLYAQVGEDGQVMDTELAHKWVCPMHPYEVSLSSALCPICQMKMVKAEDLGIVGPQDIRSRVLTIPGTAPLLTGERAVVYVEEKKENRWRYEGRVVTLGPRVEDEQKNQYYMVYSGLHEGERVVTMGNFKIDADLQIKARPSMMTPAKEKPKKKIEIPLFALGKGKYHGLMEPVLEGYFQLAKTLAYEKKKAKEIPERVKNFQAALASVDLSGAVLLSKAGREKLSSLVKEIKEKFVQNLKAGEVESVRLGLFKITPVIERYLQLFGHRLSRKIYRAHCPIAFEKKGGIWLQDQSKILNAYEGSKMRGCGDIQKSYKAIQENVSGILAKVEDAENPYFKRAFHSYIRRIIGHYLKIHSLLTQEKTALQEERTKALSILNKMDLPKLFSSKELLWARKYLQSIKLSLRDLRGKNLETLRRDFLDFSEALIGFIERFGLAYDRPLYLFFCPMYRNKLGGRWLQESEKKDNPYLEKKMRECGELRTAYAPFQKRED